MNFNGVHVACICGSNGHGKSALLDSITWALWGKARGKVQDEMISYGADECRVELDFSSRDENYRVIRSHGRGGRRRRGGASDLQLMILDGDAARPITGDMIRETQARIDQTVGMDYDTFINSAFLVQGRADEFTNKTPTERKAVLSKILGLETYDKLQIRAREGNSWAENTVKISEGNVDRLRRELDQLVAPTAELKTVETTLFNANKDLEEQKVKTSALRDQVTELRRQQAGLEESSGRMVMLAKEAEQFESAHKVSQQQVVAFEKLISQASTIREGSAQLTAARNAFARLEEAGQTFDELERLRVSTAARIDLKRTQLEGQIQQISTDIESRLNPKIQELEQIQTNQILLQEQGPEFDERATVLARERENLQGISIQIGQLQSALERSVSEGKDLAAKKELLEGANGQDPICPLCRTPLREDGCVRLVETFETDIESKREEYRTISARVKILQGEASELENRLPQQELALNQAQTNWQVELQQLEQQLKDSQQARLELEEATPRLKTMRITLADNSFAAEDSAQLKRLEEQIKELDYDPATRQQMFRESQNLEAFAQQEQLLEQAEAGLPGAKDAVEQNSALAARRREELTEMETQAAKTKGALARLTTLEAEFTQEEQLEREIGVRVQQSIDRQGYLRGQVERQESLADELRSETARLNALQDEQSIYQELAVAFGRQGVQAMLIETVVPRLEDETNLLLGRMTDNRMNVKLETQRDRASGNGDPRETLDIIVSDELGPRGYEMFSGGEAFRVNLAMRIALSKVLAQRTGAPLPTLFIDEGFGTQDAIGRERILDVISAIGNDFEKVLVITHLDDLKEAFPVSIEVLKDVNGSTFWIN
ncbi:MAG: SMC family ATPase [Dehalococcoidia bacterium]|nr:SMC family ATPase [Dehalococcoidia bacterium]